MDKRCLSAVALLTGVLALGFTSVAQAGHDDPQPRIGHTHGQPGSYCTAQSCTDSCSAGKYLFDRGFRAGRSAGWREGHYDGLYGRAFCDVPRNKVRFQPYHFRKGYKLGFRQGYASGFAKGKSDRYRRYRCRWW